MATNSTDSQEIPHILWNRNVHYRIHKVPSLPLPVSNLRQMYLKRGFPSCFLGSTVLLSSSVRLDLSSGLFYIQFSPPHPVCFSRLFFSNFLFMWDYSRRGKGSIKFYCITDGTYTPRYKQQYIQFYHTTINRYYKNSPSVVKIFLFIPRRIKGKTKRKCFMFC